MRHGLAKLIIFVPVPEKYVLKNADPSGPATTSAPRMAAADPTQPAKTTKNEARTARDRASPSQVHFTVPAKGDYTITLYDLAGKPVQILKQGYANSRERITVDLHDYDIPDGVYMVKLLASKSSQTYLRVRVEKETLNPVLPEMP